MTPEGYLCGFCEGREFTGLSAFMGDPDEFLADLQRAEKRRCSECSWGVLVIPNL